jgi:hypothetical protein
MVEFVGDTFIGVPVKAWGIGKTGRNYLGRRTIKLSLLLSLKGTLKYIPIAAMLISPRV